MTLYLVSQLQPWKAGRYIELAVHRPPPEVTIPHFGGRDELWLLIDPYSDPPEYFPDGGVKPNPIYVVA